MMRPSPLLYATPTAPALSSGDHLSRAEFEERYTAAGENFRAELIDGVVFVASPVRDTHHGRPVALLTTCLGIYEAATPQVTLSNNGTVRLDEENVAQPDVAMKIHHSVGGQAMVDDEDYVTGPPELVAEVAASTVSIDLHKKFQAYLRNQVREYIVWRVEDAALDWFILRNGAYERLPPGDDGILRSEVFPGLWLAPQPLLELNSPEVLRVVQLGLASPEHAAFVARLTAGERNE